MMTVAVMYPAGPEATFDREYYLGRHIPLVRERWTPFGLQSVQVLQGTGLADGSGPVYQAMALLTFGSLADFQKAGQAHGREIMGDIPNFTNVRPVVQFNDVTV
jgi:uncharacterized protein (TIGR02118 family)